MRLCRGRKGIPARFQSTTHGFREEESKEEKCLTEAIKLVRGLSTTSSWDDLMYRIYVRQKIDAGLADFRAGRVHPHSAIRKEFELS